jgi:hypothetical protein
VKREFSIPADLEEKIGLALKDLGVSFSDSRKLADSALRLSDFFIRSPGTATPWHESWARIAYMSYFLPLNYLRARAAIHEGEKRNFFAGLSSVIDFGAGPGTACLALAEHFSSEQMLLIEAAAEAAKLARHFGNFKFSTSFDQKAPKKSHQTLAVFSYSLTEQHDIPQWALDCEALMLLEPSTEEDGRKLQTLRGKLIEQGYFAWAPCTHQLGCPLLLHSKRDWCHDRIFFKAPAWFEAIEKLLPIKNKTLTYSYLLMRKTPIENAPDSGRLVGDQLKEKGKDRQLFCRGEKREYLSWLHKQGPSPELYRGDLFQLPGDYTEVSNEIRFPVE